MIRPSVPSWLASLVPRTGYAVGGLMLLATLAGLPGPARAQRDGNFAVLYAESRLEDGVYYLDATVDLELSSDAEQALQSGLHLTIRFEVEFLRHLRLWWDGEVATLRQRHQLEYHPLTERYIVRNVQSGDQDWFVSLDAALWHIGRIENWPLIDRAVLNPNRNYEVRLRALLDTEELPGPLRLIAFWRRDWSIGSGWYRWTLEDE